MAELVDALASGASARMGVEVRVFSWAPDEYAPVAPDVLKAASPGGNMANFLYSDDLPDNLDLGEIVAIDTETMGLNLQRDRLCVIQLSAGDGDAHIVRIRDPKRPAPNVASMLSNRKQLKLFHFGRFDMAVLNRRFSVETGPVYCTKIASKLARTYTDRHGLKDLVEELLDVKLSKQQQSSDWGRSDLTAEQVDYAAADVLYLHRVRERLNAMLHREGRQHLADACFDFLPALVRIDMAGWRDQDIFSH